MLERSRSLQIYMKPGIKEDDLMLKIWDACRKHDRPQDVFRSMLRAGLLAMLESGEMPEAIIEECNLDNLLERKRRRKRKQEPHFPYPAAFPPFGYPVPPLQQPPQPMPEWPAREHPAETPAIRKTQAAEISDPSPAEKGFAREERPTVPEPAQEASEVPTQKKKGRIGNLM